jgi:uncharacterized protein
VVDRDASLEWFLANRHAEISLFVMFLDPTPSCPQPGTPEFEEVLREHFVYWWELEDLGFLLGAGPIERDTGMAGMAVLRAESREAAEQLAANEPFAQRGYRRNTVHPWQLNEGALVDALGPDS